jgi:hypothetical protein
MATSAHERPTSHLLLFGITLIRHDNPCASKVAAPTHIVQFSLVELEGQADFRSRRATHSLDNPVLEPFPQPGAADNRLKRHSKHFAAWSGTGFGTTSCIVAPRASFFANDVPHSRISAGGMTSATSAIPER